MKLMTKNGLGGVLSIVIVGGVAGGCGDSKTVPTSMVGSYVRTEATMMGLFRQTANLEVTSTGITARSAGMGVEMGATRNGPQGRISESVSTSVLFKSVACSGGSTCKFVGSDDLCEGTISRDGAGDVTIVASGLCATPISGKWLGPKSAANLPQIPDGPQLH